LWPSLMSPFALANPCPGVSDLPTGVVDLFRPRLDAVPVLDPMLRRLGPVWVNRDHVIPSQASAPSTDGLAPHLCLRFQVGECRSGPNCPQWHVNPKHMDSVRQQLSVLLFSDCCPAHGNFPSLRSDFRVLLSGVPVVLTFDGGFEVGIPQDLIAVTAFWHQFLIQSPPPLAFTFSSARVCRLHQRQACKFGRDCNNIHICRSFWGELSAVLKARAPMPSPARGPRPYRPTEPLLPSQLPRSVQDYGPSLSNVPSSSSHPVQPPPIVLLDLAAKRGIHHRVKQMESPNTFMDMITQGLSLEECQSLSRLLKDGAPTDDAPGKAPPLRGM